MRALVSCTEPPHAELAEVDEPSPLPHEAVVSVSAVSLNRGEVRRLERMEPGDRSPVGTWRGRCTVRRRTAAARRRERGWSGVKLAGAWAERVAISTEFLAELPDGISLEQAATLPVAGLTALRALEIGGFVLGKRVLVTGASGGVGHLAIQLARLAGAHVTGVARRTEGLAELGADEVLSELEPRGRPST